MNKKYKKLLIKFFEEKINHFNNNYKISLLNGVYLIEENYYDYYENNNKAIEKNNIDINLLLKQIENAILKEESYPTIILESIDATENLLGYNMAFEDNIIGLLVNPKNEFSKEEKIKFYKFLLNSVSVFDLLSQVHNIRSNELASEEKGNILEAFKYNCMKKPKECLNNLYIVMEYNFYFSRENKDNIIVLLDILLPEIEKIDKEISENEINKVRQRVGEYIKNTEDRQYWHLYKKYLPAAAYNKDEPIFMETDYKVYCLKLSRKHIMARHPFLFEHDELEKMFNEIIYCINKEKSLLNITSLALRYIADQNKKEDEIIIKIKSEKNNDLEIEKIKKIMTKMIYEYQLLIPVKKNIDTKERSERNDFLKKTMEMEILNINLSSREEIDKKIKFKI